MRKKLVTACLAGGALLLIGSAVAAESAAALKGEELFQLRCLHCHGAKGDGSGHLIEFLKVKPADLTRLTNGADPANVTDRVLKAVLGRHETGNNGASMPLLKDYLTVEQVHYLSEYIKMLQR